MDYQDEHNEDKEKRARKVTTNKRASRDIFSDALGTYKGKVIPHRREERRNKKGKKDILQALTDLELEQSIHEQKEDSE